METSTKETTKEIKDEENPSKTLEEKPKDKPKKDEKSEVEMKKEERVSMPEKKGTKVVENGGNEDDAESSEEELGSLEKPIEILTRKRDRKSVNRLSLNITETIKKVPEDDYDYSQGKGIKLGDVLFIKHMVDKTHSDDLKPLYRLLYHKSPKTMFVKREIRAFCGFPFGKDSECHKRLVSSLDRFLVPGLKFVCSILGLEKAGDKEKLKERLLQYLYLPEDMQKNVPTLKSSKSKKSKDTKIASSSKKKTQQSSEKVSDVSVDSETDEDDEPKSCAPKKKALKTIVKISGPKRKPVSKKEDTKRQHVESDSDNDDEPLVKKTKMQPSDSDIEKVVQDILKDANLEEVTMKTVCKQVYDHFPDFDLTSRRDFIKSTVKETIS